MVAVKRGISLVEVLVCVALLGLVLIPLGLLVLRSRETAVQSRLALVAAHAAREEIEDTRVLSHALGADPRRLSHGWQPVPAGPLARLGPLAAGARATPERYPADYRRIFTKLEVLAGPDPRIFPAILEVRWQEHGEDPAQAAARGQTGRFEFLVVRSKRVGS